MNCVRSGRLAASAVAVVAALATARPALAADLTTYTSGYAQAGAIVDGDVGKSVAVPDGATASGAWSANDGFSSASASIVGAPVVQLRADVSATTGGSATAEASISYVLTVTGPTGFTDLVPILFNANLMTTGAVSRAPTGSDGEPYALAEAALVLAGDIFSAGPNIFESRYCITACQFGDYANGLLVGGADGQAANPSLTYAISGLAGLHIGAMGIINEEISITTHVGSIYLGQTSSASASADPYFFIDPAFALEHPDISLEVSPAVGNNPLGGGAPEPGAWALMLLGFGTAGALLRRRRGAVAT